jgi:hypothetical protein
MCKKTSYYHWFEELGFFWKTMLLQNWCAQI